MPKIIKILNYNNKIIIDPMMAIQGYILFGMNSQTGIFVENIRPILLLTLAIYKLSEYLGKKYQ